MSSFLQAQGHPDARCYPLPFLWAEAEIARRRVAATAAAEATLMQLAVASILSKKAGSSFRKEIKKLLGGQDGTASR